MIRLALLAALLLAPPAPAQEEQPPAPHGPGIELPRCSQGQAADEGDLFAALGKAGLKLESAHTIPGGGTQLTFAGAGLWVVLRGDGNLACALAAGRDEEIAA